MEANTERASARARRPVLALILLAHAALLVGAARTDFVVLDEVGHVPAGVYHWETGGFALYRVNPPLARMLAAVPVLLARPVTVYNHLDEAPGARSDWEVGRDFCRANGPRYFDLVGLARLSSVAWSLAAAVVIYRWARDLYGEWAGRLGAALWCFDPTILTFGHLVVPDVPSASAAVMATYVFWRYLRDPSHGRAAAAGLLLGVAQLTKFTLLVLYLLWPLFWLLDRRGGPRRPGGGKASFLHLLLILVLSVDVINIGYGCLDTFRPLGQFTFVSRALVGPESRLRTGNRFRGRWLGRIPVPVPAEYLQGIDAQRRDFESRFPSYLRGQWRDGGWWYYYLYALAVKEPLGTLGLVLWGLALTLRGRPSFARRTDELIPLLSAGAVLGLVSSQTGFNHHMRYVLPLYPFVAVGTGKVACLFTTGRPRRGWAAAALLSWSVGSTLSIYPHTMSYFNELAGGPGRGHDHLLDSNIDWGQDLFALKDWLDRHPEARPFGLAFFHFLDPRDFGIEYRLPPFGPGPAGEAGNDPGSHPADGPRPGYYAVSVNYLRGITFDAPNGDGGRTWVPRHDAFTYFRRFRPIARAGYSIYIYHITPSEADAARRAMGLPPLTGPARAGVDDRATPRTPDRGDSP